MAKEEHASNDALGASGDGIAYRLGGSRYFAVAETNSGCYKSCNLHQDDDFCALRLDCVLVFMIPDESWRLLRLEAFGSTCTWCRLSISDMFRHGTATTLRFLSSS